MDDQQRCRPVYASAIPFEAARIGAAAIYCSDGRFGEQFDDFLQQGLGLPRYDRLAVPGGAACLAGHFATYREEDAVAAQLEFLVAAHGLRQVILIAHQDCAFYTTRLEVTAIDLLERQLEDLAKAAQRVRGIHSGLAALPFFARREGDLVTFDQVQV